MSNLKNTIGGKITLSGLAASLGPAPTLDEETTAQADKVLRLRSRKRDTAPTEGATRPTTRLNVQHVNTNSFANADALSFPATTSAAIDIIDTSLSRYNNRKD